MHPLTFADLAAQSGRVRDKMLEAVEAYERRRVSSVMNKEDFAQEAIMYAAVTQALKRGR